jgi:hypothetical protein
LHFGDFLRNGKRFVGGAARIEVLEEAGGCGFAMERCQAGLGVLAFRVFLSRRLF